MVKILLKKQLAQMYRSYFFDVKKGVMRSKGSVILRFGLFALLMIGVCGVLFGVISYMLCEPFCALELGWLYFAIMGLVAIALGSFGSVFNTFAGLYLAKDNDLLLSMPIPVSAIMASRLLGVYLMGLMYSALVSLGSVVVYLIFAEFSFGALLGGLFYVFFISIVVLILSCLLGWVVARISVKLKNKSFITVIVSVAGLALYYFFYFKAQSVLPVIVQNATVYGQQVKSHAFFLYGFGRMAQGSFFAILACMGSACLAFALMWIVLKNSFIHVATGGSGGRKKLGYKNRHVENSLSAVKPRSVRGALQGESCSGVKPRSVHGALQGESCSGVKPRSVHGALLWREFGRFKSSASYMLNCGFGTLFLVVFAIALAVKASFVQQMLVELSIPGDALMVFGLCAICLVACMNDMATPSISLEGTSLWIVQSLPVRAWDVLQAKLSVQILLTAPFATLCVIVMSCVMGFSFVEFVVAFAFVLSFVFCLALFDLFIGVKLPNLTWTNELTPIKQSLAVFIALFAGWMFIAAIIGLYILVVSPLRVAFGSRGDILFLGSFTILLSILCVVLAQWLKKGGSRLFERL